MNTMNRVLPVDPAFLRARGRAETIASLGRIVRSVRFELLESESAVRLLGPDMSYHALDPHLAESLQDFSENLGIEEILSYRSRTSLFDLCLEDSWTGSFLADYLGRLDSDQNLVLIHLDHHMDMMPTLLCRVGDRLVNPMTDSTFDSAKGKDWEDAIHSGCISIGNFITPLFYSGRRIHVRHLGDHITDDYRLQYVKQQGCCYDLIPNREFAAISKEDEGLDMNAGTYLGGRIAAEVLKSLPPGIVIVHIDLDYFVNDIGGNPGATSSAPHPDLISVACGKMNDFFEALPSLAPTVDQWIIGTSPGFCSARHWRWLLAEIGARIETFGTS